MAAAELDWARVGSAKNGIEALERIADLLEKKGYFDNPKEDASQ